MKFFDRKKEIDQLHFIDDISYENAQFTIITGRRRIGKTELVRKAYEGRRMLYFFVARKAESELCQTFIEEIKEQLDLPLLNTSATKFADVFRYVMEVAKSQHIILFIDEFQEFFRINPSVYSDMQNIWDSYKRESNINLVVAGSVYSLMNKIFKDEKEPLFGRQTNMMHVRPFRPSVIKDILCTYHPDYTDEDLLALYAFTGGVAKYIELFIDQKRYTRQQMLDMILMPDSYFISEGKNLLIEEFGKDYGVYFSILSLIAQGQTTRKEIESVITGKELSGYLRNLSEEYDLISKKQPMFESAPNKNVHYAINDQFLRFWFRFIYKYIHIIEAEGYERLKALIERDFPTFSGLTLESYFTEKLKETGMYTRIGYWHDRKGQNEIDIIAADELDRVVQFIEVKRNEDNIDLPTLRAKAEVFLRGTGAFQDFTLQYLGLSLKDM